MKIDEGNKLIAEFMGYQILSKKYETQHWCSSNESQWVVNEGDIVCDTEGNEVDNQRNKPYFRLEEVPFNLSWDWLMPVIDKIEDTDVSNQHYKWYAHDGERSNFMSFEFNICNKSSYVMMELQLDPAVRVAGDFNIKYDTRIESTWNTVIEFIQYYYNTYKKEDN